MVAIVLQEFFRDMDAQDLDDGDVAASKFRQFLAAHFMNRQHAGLHLDRALGNPDGPHRFAVEPRKPGRRKFVLLSPELLRLEFGNRVLSSQRRELFDHLPHRGRRQVHHAFRMAREVLGHLGVIQQAKRHCPANYA